MDNDLREAIYAHVSYIDDKYWEDLLVTFSADEVFGELFDLLNSNSYRNVNKACLFLRELVWLERDIGSSKEFKERFNRSPLVQQLHKLADSPGFLKRRDAVCAVMVTKSKESAYALKEIFEKRKETDPLLLHYLTSIISWLTGEHDMEWIKKQCLESPSYTIRWVGLEILHGWWSIEPDEGKNQTKREVLSSLLDDPNQHVREFAQYYLDGKDLLSILSNMQMEPVRKEGVRIVHSGNKRDWTYMITAFVNMMSADENNDFEYNVSQLEKFIEDEYSDNK